MLGERARSSSPSRKVQQYEVLSRITSHFLLCDRTRPICISVGRHIAGSTQSTDQKHYFGARCVGRWIKLVKADSASSGKRPACRLRPEPTDLLCRRCGCNEADHPSASWPGSFGRTFLWWCRHH